MSFLSSLVIVNLKLQKFTNIKHKVYLQQATLYNKASTRTIVFLIFFCNRQGLFLVLEFCYKNSIGGQTFMKKYRFSKNNLHLATVILIIMFTCSLITFLVLAVTLHMRWEFFAFLFAFAITIFFFLKRLFPGTISVDEDAFYYKGKTYPYSQYIIECDAKLIRFTGASRSLPYYRIVIISRDTRAEKLIRVYNMTRKYNDGEKHLQEKMEELRDQLKQYQS